MVKKKSEKHKRDWTWKGVALFESIFFLYLMVLGPMITGSLTQPQVHISAMIEPTHQFTIDGYSQQITGILQVLDETTEPKTLVGWDFTTGSTEDQVGTVTLTASGFWAYGHSYAFTIYSGNFTDKFIILNLRKPTQDSHFYYLKTDHFYITFTIW